MDNTKLDELLLLLEELEKETKYNKLKHFVPDGWHKDMFEAGKTERVRGVLSANRTGKSYAASAELAMHLTGLYPSWWNGHRFDRPIDAMALGSSWSQMMGQKAIHELFFGPAYDIGSGWIPKNCIVDTRGAGQLGAIGFAQIKHISGGISTLKMATYGQGDSNIMGSALSFFLVDEDPNDATIINQLIKRGWSIPDSRGLVVMTPEHGLTKSVEMFWDEKGLYHSGLIHRTLFDSTLYSEEQKQTMLNSIEPWARRFSIYGEPSAGAASVFQGIAADDITLPTPEIQRNWKRMSAIDFGKRDANVVTFIAWDPESDTYYLYDEVATEGKDAIEVAPLILPRQKGFIPMIAPADGSQERGTGVTLVQIYKESGVIVAPKHCANWNYDSEGKNRSISTGIAFMRKLMKEGRFFVSPKCQLFLKEFSLYSFDDNGKFVDKNNHAIDSCRYCITAISTFGISENDSKQNNNSGGFIPDDGWD